MVYLEIESGGLYPPNGADLDRFSLIHDQLRGFALGERESAELITEVIQHL